MFNAYIFCSFGLPFKWIRMLCEIGRIPDSSRHTINTPEKAIPNEKKYEIFNPNLEYIVAPKRQAKMPADDSA